MATASHDVKKDLKLYILVFVLLLVGTLITVAAWKWGGNILSAVGIPATLTVTIVIALFIATIKAFLVAGYFMHLMSERKTVYAVLAATAFFFVAMMYLIVWSRDEMPSGTFYWENKPVHAPPNAADTGTVKTH